MNCYMHIVDVHACTVSFQVTSECMCIMYYVANVTQESTQPGCHFSSSGRILAGLEVAAHKATPLRLQTLLCFWMHTVFLTQHACTCMYMYIHIMPQTGT